MEDSLVDMQPVESVSSDLRSSSTAKLCGDTKALLNIGFSDDLDHIWLWPQATIMTIKILGEYLEVFTKE